MNKKQQNSFGRWLSFVLRHEPQQVAEVVNKIPQDVIDIEGFMDIEDIFVAYRLESGLQGTMEDLKAIVKSSSKDRYGFSTNETHIRAKQGHSTPLVDLNHKEAEPPPTLYHGTATKSVPLIQKGGLKKMSRHHVHLSDNLETASQVGNRHGKLVILEIDTVQMIADGFKFYISDNGVWLTDNVPSKYLSKLDFY